jgi:hypothetical protein
MLVTALLFSTDPQGAPDNGLVAIRHCQPATLRQGHILKPQDIFHPHMAHIKLQHWLDGRADAADRHRPIDHVQPATGLHTRRNIVIPELHLMS